MSICEKVPMWMKKPQYQNKNCNGATLGFESAGGQRPSFPKDLVCEAGVALTADTVR